MNKTKSASRAFPRPREDGIAIILILAFLVLLTGLVFAFFSRAIAERQVANSSLNESKADLLARTAVDVIVGDLKQEIVDGSATPATGVSFYLPKNPVNMLPQTSGTPTPVPAGTIVIPNLVRRSVRNDPLAQAAPLAPAFKAVTTSASAVNSTTDPSVDNRSVNLARWNSHYLIPRDPALYSGPSANNIGTDPIPSFTAPDWVMVTTTGPKVLGAPDKTTIGRYAYAIYDEGGLLDANVAGYPQPNPTPSGPSVPSFKGSLAFADLAKLPTQPAPSTSTLSQTVVNDLVGWRNYASTQPGGTFGSYTFDPTAAKRYYDSVLSNTNGFLSVSVAPAVNGQTDQIFTSRQALLNYRRATGFSQDALQHLGTFSRELNAPSWGPTQNASDLGGTVGGSFDYKTNRDSATAVNRLIPNVRAANAGMITSYRNDGSSYIYPVKAGDPLVQRRFPLGRLNWIGAAGPQNGGTTENIQKCFGLAWDAPSGMWRYMGATGTAEQSAIKKLGEIASETQVREPNFFELLQAGILNGSLGLELHISAGGASNTYNYWTDLQKSSTLNVFRIGASILSQYEASSCPIVIEFLSPAGRPWQACGIDNLPYLNLLNCLAGADPASPNDNIAAYLMLGLWNPHQIPQGAAVTRPSIRLQIRGQVTVANNYGRHLKTTKGYARNPLSFPTNPYSYVKNLNATAPLSSAAGLGVNGFVDPHALLPSDLATAPDAGSPAGLTWATLPPLGGTAYAGYRLPNYVIDPTDMGAPEPTNDGPSPLGTNPSFWNILWFAVNTNLVQPFNCWLEFQNPGGTWVPYNYHANINDSDFWFSKGPGFTAMTITDPSTGLATSPPTLPVIPSLNPPTNSFSCSRYPWLAADPRSLRFNYFQSQTTKASPDWTNYLGASIWSSGTEPGRQTLGMAGAQVIEKYFALAYNPATLARNNTTPPGTSTTPSAYPDPDGVQRIADSGLYTSSPNVATGGSVRWEGDPYALSGTRSNDRPVVLNRPFNSVADLGYVPRDSPWRTLDFFTAKSADAGLLDLFTVTDTDSSIVAGRVNLNSRNAAVLTAVLAGATADVVGGAPISKPSVIAADLVKLTSMTPLTGRDEIATKLVSSLTAADFTTTSTNTDEQNVKTRREGVTRALSDAGQTRTWNLLIDVIAQAGRYPVTAKKLGDFVVDGERRYWLHVAIDRFTGEVIDQQLEPVAE